MTADANTTSRGGRFKRRLLPLAILGGLAGLAALLLLNPPQADRRPASDAPLLTVEVVELQRRPYRVRLQSYGTVQPRTQSTLFAQVSGQIVEVASGFREGRFFERGDTLLTIDPRDYQADVKIAEAALMDARQSLEEEKARAEQAELDWQRLGDGKPAPDLVLRKPQLTAARARVISAESTLQKASLDLERTRVVAPFAGRILRKFVDLGQVVSGNTQLAEVYATDYVEIRLPLRDRDLPFIELPERYRFRQTDDAELPEVELISELGGGEPWRGRVTHTEGAIDDTARQLHVVAQIEDPWGERAAGRTPLKIGQYVTAGIAGKTLDDALVIPSSAIYQGSYAYVVTDGILRRRDIEILWQGTEESIIAAGLEAGDRLVTTPLGQVASGVRVAIQGQAGRKKAANAAAGTREAGSASGSVDRSAKGSAKGAAKGSTKGGAS